MSAREILGLRRDFTPDQLRANFRALALHLHPDKTALPPQEANALFQRLIAAYNELRDAPAGEASTAAGGESSAKQFDELRGGKAQARGVDETLRKAAAASLGGGGGSSAFDIDRFNKVFAKLRVPDASVDDGYSKWMDKVTPEQVAARQAQKRGVQVYTEPEPLVSCHGLQYSEIGLGRTRDYGRGSETVGQGHALGFTDYRVAHSTDSRVIDPDTVRPRAAYGTMLELEAARSMPSQPLTPTEQRARALQERRAADLEATRHRTLQRQAATGIRHQADVTSALLTLEGRVR